MSRNANIFESSKDLMDTWNAWADCVEKVFQQMGIQTGDLEVSDDEYISFVHMFASHPARPTQQQLENMIELEDWSIKAMPHRYLTHLHSLWTAYADKLETTYVSMSGELGRCNLLASPFETTSTRGQLHSILRSMLGPGRLFQGLADSRAHEVVDISLQEPSVTHTDQLVSGIERMSLCGTPAASIEGIEEVVVELKNMNIKVGIS